MRVVTFTQTALNEMSQFKWGKQSLAFKMLELIADIQKNPFTGLGKPEPLKEDRKG